MVDFAGKQFSAEILPIELVSLLMTPGILSVYDINKNTYVVTYSRRYSELSTTANLCDGIPECIGLTDECRLRDDDMKVTADSKEKLCNAEQEPSYCVLAGRIWLVHYLVCFNINMCVMDDIMHYFAIVNIAFGNSGLLLKNNT